ncbi:MAG: formimidoylglutamate deiminase [Polyangiaceae bacterium]|nr:formimidoylglutamate deiminase [Polyangiaceae bacterium]
MAARVSAGVYHCEQLFDGQRWHRPGRLRVEAGVVTEVGALGGEALGERRPGDESARREVPPGDEAATWLPGITAPGMPNLHSHAFQRALAGLTERASPAGQDSFWSWRELMYRFVERLSPSQVSAIAELLYVELLEHGYTSTAEFHYLHHGPGGEPYADLAELGRHVAEAARGAGMRLVLLPVYYETSGFGAAPIAPEQRRFYNRPERYLRLLQALESEVGPLVSLGVALHSLRAAPLEGRREILAVLASAASDHQVPVHIHVAEQVAEVEAALAHHGARPVELLLSEHEVDARWCLVHATHVTEEELRGVVRAGATLGLCPTTEANLGDGLFPLPKLLDLGGSFGIGSDSQVCVCPAEELRLLEYGQRLTTRARAVSDRSSPPRGTGARLYSEALRGGAKALGGGMAMSSGAAMGSHAETMGGGMAMSSGMALGRLAPGCHADLVVLDGAHPSLLGRTEDRALDSWVFAPGASPVRQVMVGGVWRVLEGRHVAHDAARKRYAAEIGELFEAL